MLIFLDSTLAHNIRNSNLIIPHIRTLAQSPPTSVSSSLGTRSHRTISQSYDGTEHGDGSGEISVLAKRILDFAEGDSEVFQSIHHNESDDESQLRRSVHEALGHSTGLY